MAQINAASEATLDARRPRWRAALLLWTIFCAGLIVQLLAPRLKVEHNAFVMPQAMISGKQQIRPAELVARERMMQLLSVMLTISGAIGLGIHYRATLFRRRSHEVGPY
jgi:hypothetical protein